MIRKDSMKAESEVIGKRGGTIKKYMISFIYLIGIVATIVMLIYSVALLFIAIVVIIGWVILFLMGKAQKSMGSARSSGPNYDERREKEITEGFGHMGHCESCIHYPGHASHCSHRGIVYSNTSSCMYYRRH